jgi:hypothetical protein
LHARRGRERWIIEAKGAGSLDPMRVIYFLDLLGETLQRMDDPNAAYLFNATIVEVIVLVKAMNIPLVNRSIGFRKARDRQRCLAKA